ncbi:MAG: hypothetical protein EOL97_13400 [Spirochaetia bacterium]|nr:hypothetical protein [Spirochaetia bacterium]
MENKKNTVLKKLVEARSIIKNIGENPKGHNEYSKFDYYTPSQIESLVDKACEKTNTIVLCNLKADEFGLYQTLEFIDLDSEEKLSFEMRTKHGSITATNETQQMGGTDTYSERYIKMKVFQIKDNNLDIDSQDNRDNKENGKETVKNQGVKHINEIDEKKEKIVSLCKRLGITGNTAKDYEAFVFAKTSHALKEDRYDSIIERLETLINKK